MVGDDSVIEMMETALRRFPFLDSLEGEPKDKRTLVDELDYSRSTVNRGIRELEALDLVAYDDGGYRITPLGELVATDFVDLADTVELRLQYEPFLEWMPEDEFDLDLDLLREGDLVLPKQGDPYAVINKHVKQLETLQEGRFLLPFVGLHAVEIAYDRVINQRTTVEIVVLPGVLSTFQSNSNYAPLVEEMVETGRLDVFLYEDEMPFSLGIFDDVVQLIADEEEEPRALIESSHADVRMWAEATFEEYKQDAEPVMESRKMKTKEEKIQL